MKELQREDEDLPGTEQPRQAGVCQARGPWGARIRVRVEHGATSEQEGLMGLRTPHGNLMVRRRQASQPREQREQRRGGQEETDEGRLKVQLEGGGAWSRATAPGCRVTQPPLALQQPFSSGWRTNWNRGEGRERLCDPRLD